jgi:hypothetical protein
MTAFCTSSPVTEPPNLSSLLFVPNLEALFRPGVLPFRSFCVLGILFAQIFLHHHARLCLRLLFESLPTSSDRTRMSPKTFELVRNPLGLGFQVGLVSLVDAGIPRPCSKVKCSSLCSSGCLCRFLRLCSYFYGGEVPLRSGLFTLSRPTSRAI